MRSGQNIRNRPALGTIRTGDVSCRLRIVHADATLAQNILQRLLELIGAQIPHLVENSAATASPAALLQELERCGGWRLPVVNNDPA
jgi:hypothetical protein